MAEWESLLGNLGNLASHVEKMAAGAATGVQETGGRVTADMESFVTQATTITDSAAIKAKDMVTNFADEHPIKIEEVIEAASRVPGVRIDRENYLLGALNVHATECMAQSAVATSPAEAGVPEELIDKLANDAIAYENNLATATSVVAGLPSNPVAMIGATAADLGQFYAHVLRIVQKLGYLYGWSDIFRMEGDQMDDATRNTMVLFLGVMSGVNSAEKTLMVVARNAGVVTGKRIARQALTKGTIYPIVKKIAYYLGLQMNKQIFGRAVGHAIPILGGVASGVITRATFSPMAHRLKDYLTETPLAKPSNAVVTDIESYDIDDLSTIETEIDNELEELERS